MGILAGYGVSKYVMAPAFVQPKSAMSDEMVVSALDNRVGGGRLAIEHESVVESQIDSDTPNQDNSNDNNYSIHTYREHHVGHTSRDRR